jgi:hypothetical protein
MIKTINVLFVALFVISLPLRGQDTDSPEAPVGKFIFLDCNARNCDFDHFRREIPWVNWVRDRKDGDVHLLITQLRTSGGGIQYTIDYIGLKNLTGNKKTLIYIADPDDTATEIRGKLTNMIAFGLLQFIDPDPDVAANLQITYKAPAIRINLEEEADPWDLWVYRAWLRGSMEGESYQSEYNLSGGGSAGRVTEEYKINIALFAWYSNQQFEDVGSGDVFINIAEDYTAEIETVWSLSPRWSLGGFAEANKSTFWNRNLAIFAGPAIEYNIYPYSESTRKMIIFRYTLEATYFDYELVTVQGKSEETIGRHKLLIRAAIQQPWGEVRASIEGIQYLNDPSTHRINSFLRLEYRIFRGFNIDIFARYSRIKDQFFLPAEGLSPEEILLRRRQRETDFRFDVGLGLSYRFGSKFANIVNPRF